MDTDTVLAAASSAEPSDFNELCRGLGGDCPQDRAEWATLFRTIEECERNGLMEVSRLDGRIDTVILTEAGAAQVRAKLDAKRGLFSSLG